MWRHTWANGWASACRPWPKTDANLNGADQDATTRALEIHRRLAKVYPIPAGADSIPGGAGRLSLVDELVSTILSQNTTDLNRDRGFDALRARYDSWAAVADAPTDEVIDAIRVAGLANQKGPRIQGALRAVMNETGGEIQLDFLRSMTPDEARSWLTSIKGVGIKTASIVLLFGLDMPAFPVDTHVHRVTGRLGLIPPRTTADRAHHLLEEIVPEELYLPLHMEFVQHGRAVCRAPRPRCSECVLADICRYSLEDSLNEPSRDR